MVKQFSHLILSIFFIAFTFLMGLLPFRGLYIFSDLLAFILGKAFRYRKKIILDNLTQSNLNLTEEQKKELLPKIYKNLADIIVEGLKSFVMSKRNVLKRHKVINPEITEPFFQKKQNLILVTGHIGNWEWGSLSAGLQTPFHIIGIYKPLNNKFVDRFMRWSRSRFGTTLVATKQTKFIFEENHEHPKIFLMASDQSPTRVQYSYWVDFLGRKTAFIHGPEKYARIMNYPVVFADIKRTKRGFYVITLSVLAENPAEMPEGEVTRLYAHKLESLIASDPASWLWSHKRWKHKIE